MQSKTLSVFILTSILFVTVFGFLGMGMLSEGTTHLCPFSSVAIGDCTILKSVVSIAAHHFAALQNLAWTMASFDILFLVFSILFLFALFPVRTFLLKIFPLVARSIFFRNEEPSLAQKIRLLRWLAYHNKRDYLAPVRVRIES